MSARPRRQPIETDHGPHTLRVWPGTVVGIYGDDVFCELGPRMQGVISAREFERPPAVGERYEFTLRGREESLWVLALRHARSLSSWEEMEGGSMVSARVVRRTHGGLELKVGPLHAFLPKSQTGLARDADPDQLVGKTITVEVIEVDRERQRVMVSRKLVLERERLGRHQRELGALAPGQVVQGRVTRVERYGVFVRFGAGLQGLIHVSNLSYERVEDPGDVLKKGDAVTAKVLSIKRGGKRIALGLRQMQESPWADLEKVHYVDELVEGTVTRVEDYGAFVAIRRGVEGLLHRSECGFGPEHGPRAAFHVGDGLSVRIAELDCAEERLSLSLLHRSGARIEPDEAAAARSLADAQLDGPPRSPLGELGRKLREALGERSRLDAG